LGRGVIEDDGGCSGGKLDLQKESSEKVAVRARKTMETKRNRGRRITNTA
jgi:hypothetical protein